MTQFRGVNLGGWLVLERWITPELFEGTEATDEYTLCKNYPEIAKKRIEYHRETFITEKTIQDIKELGLDTARLPVGYWLFGGEKPFIDGADEYVDKVMDWCDSRGIGVILDFHAAPGSQNGWDHSGRAGNIRWGLGDTLQRSYDFIEQLMDRYGDKTALRGLEVLNEPHWYVPMDTLLDYYDSAYRRIRARYPGLTVVMSDSFRPEKMAKALQKRRYTGVMLDVHLYQLYTESDRALDLDGHLQKADKDWRKLLRGLTKRIPVIVGEWSAAMHEVHQPIDQLSRVLRYTNNDYAAYFRAQRNVFEDCGVSRTYWTAKTSQKSPWSLLDHPEYIAYA